MSNNIREKKIKFTAVEIVNLLGELELTPAESLSAVTKVMHFIIEKGFCQSEAKTTELIAKALGTMTLTSALSNN